MALPNIAPVLAKEFVIAKLDYDRGIGARDVSKTYSIDDVGLPSFAFVDGDGKLVINSNIDGVKHNVGHPYQPDEVAYFKVMLEKVKKHLTDADIATLITTLEAENKKTPG
jgi:hypothetical protein